MPKEMVEGMCFFTRRDTQEFTKYRVWIDWCGRPSFLQLNSFSKSIGAGVSNAS